MNEPVASLRERKKQQTRVAIHDAALRLAAEHGPDKITVDQIVESSNVSRRTFSNYFSSKEDAIVNWDPERGKILRAMFEARPEDEDPLHSLAVVYAEKAVTEHVSENWRLVMELVRTNPALASRWTALTSFVEDELTEAVAARLGVDPRRNMYPTVIVAVAVAAARATARAHWQDQDDRPLPTLIYEAFDYIAAGLPAETVRRNGRSRRRHRLQRS